MPVPPHLSKLLAFTRAKWKSPHCQLCGENAWAIEGPADIELRAEPGSLQEALGVRGGRLPCASFTCRNCGNTVLVNMVVAGLEEK